MRTLLLLAPLLVSGSLVAQTFTLTSTDVGGQATDQQVYNGFGCTGRNQSPQLSWANAPAGTKSFAVTMYDPDAPTGSGWWHWVVFDLPASTSMLPTGAGQFQFKPGCVVSTQRPKRSSTPCSSGLTV